MSAWKIKKNMLQKDPELNRQKQTLKEQQQQRLTVTYNGGIFKVDMQLLSYLYMKCANAGLFQQSREDIIPDSYDTPIKVDVPRFTSISRSTLERSQ